MTQDEFVITKINKLLRLFEANKSKLTIKLFNIKTHLILRWKYGKHAARYLENRILQATMEKFFKGVMNDTRTDGEM